MAKAVKIRRRIAFVTGASFGVGAASALALAEDGYDLAVSATRIDNLNEISKKLNAAGARVVPVALDLRFEPSVKAALAAACDALGPIDVLVNNAATDLRRSATEVTRADWDTVIGTNLTGTFFLTQDVGQRMIAGGQQGAIITVASTLGLVGAAERAIYGMSKAALIQMTRMLAIEWAPHGIRVNAIAPGRIETASTARGGTSADPKYLEAMLARIPLKRLATSEEAGAAVAYLASPAAASITGQTLVIDGGLTTV